MREPAVPPVRSGREFERERERDSPSGNNRPRFINAVREEARGENHRPPREAKIQDRRRRGRVKAPCHHDGAPPLSLDELTDREVCWLSNRRYPSSLLLNFVT